jgi:DNA-binding transcriptional MerR regulator
MHSVDDMVRAGCTSRRGVRFWEEKGLLGPVERTAGDTRRYTDEQLNKAKIIAAAQFGGWSLEEISQMLIEWGPEVHEAILTRLADQAMAAARLATDLPPPGASRRKPDADGVYCAEIYHGWKLLEFKDGEWWHLDCVSRWTAGDDGCSNISLRRSKKTACSFSPWGRTR